MSTRPLILIDQEFQTKVLEELKSLKKILTQQKSKPELPTEKPMATADVMAYLNISRRTLINYRKRGLKPTNDFPGKKFYWKKDVDDFIAKNFNN